MSVAPSIHGFVTDLLPRAGLNPTKLAEQSALAAEGRYDFSRAATLGPLLAAIDRFGGAPVRDRSLAAAICEYEWEVDQNNTLYLSQKGYDIESTVRLIPRPAFGPSWSARSTGNTPSRIEATTINGMVVNADTFTPALNDWQADFRDDAEELQERLAAITQAMPKPAVKPSK